MLRKLVKRRIWEDFSCKMIFIYIAGNSRKNLTEINILNIKEGNENTTELDLNYSTDFLGE